MPRRKRLRKVVAPPGFAGFKPYGTSGPVNGHIDLLYEEYEALKLVDYDLMNHLEASKLMGISRPTLARIYEEARRKIARALVEQREIRTTFGNAWMDGSWYLCNDCHSKFTIPVSNLQRVCPMCRLTRITAINNE